MVVVRRNRDGRRVDFVVVMIGKFLVGGSSEDGWGGRNGIRGNEDGIAVVAAAVAVAGTGRRGLNGFAV